MMAAPASVYWVAHLKHDYHRDCLRGSRQVLGRKFPNLSG
jgi:hypothetical protein